MRVCVTGGTGFVGRALVRRLLAEGAQVRVLARPSPRVDGLEKTGVEVVRGDLSDAAAIGRAVEGTDVVYHTGAKVEGHGSRDQFFEVNVGGTERVLAASLRAKVRRVVYLSSIAVYGPIAPETSINEDTPFDDVPEERDFYAQSKIEADRLAMKFSGNPDIGVIILRPGIVYGPGKPLPTALLGWRLGKLDFVFGRATQPFPLNYVENLIDAMTLVARAPDRESRRFIVIDDDALTLGQYHSAREKVQKTWTMFFSAQPVISAASCARPVMKLVPPTAGAFSPRQIIRASQDRWYDTRRIREEAGWSPKVPLREAIEQTVRGTP
jgi:nucleoside-diphosphate-sugar epimerase